MEIKRLSTEHYDELLELLNYTFGNKYGRKMDFLSEQPKMWVRDEEHMRCNIGAFEGGKLCATVGVYPLRTVIGDREFLFATTGNVATHPDCVGRGYFNALFSEAMRALEDMGADAGRLGGDRQRYGRFGYEGCGVSYSFKFAHKNRIRCFGEGAGADICFTQISRTDIEALEFCRELRMRKAVHVERSSDNGYRDVYLSLGSKSSTPYVATREGKPIGYLCVSGDLSSVYELEALDIDAFRDTVCAWQIRIGGSYEISVPAFEVEQVRLLTACAECWSVTYPSRFKILNWQGITDAVMRMSSNMQKMLDGELILGIKGYGCIRLFVKDGAGGCEATDKDPEITLDSLRASRLLFGPADPISVADISPIPRSWLPLPFSWGALDAI